MSDQIEMFATPTEIQKTPKNAELTEILEVLKSQFECNDISNFFDKIVVAYTQNDSDFYKKLSQIICRYENDCIRMIYQYWCADRENFKQDFTPETLSQLVAKLAIRDNSYTILDCCAGVGSLTLQAAKLFKNKKFTLLEKNEKTLPFTKANVNANGINATIIHYDVIEDLNLEGDAEDSAFTCDCCISNPPFNLKWQHPLFALQLPRFQIALPPEQNANFTFVLTAMSHTENIGAFILPCSICNSEYEKDVRKNLLLKNLIEAVISVPGRMFESTDIPTTILLINKKKTTKKVCLIKIDEVSCKKETRLQKGQYGGTSHTNRTYEKIVNTIPSDLQDKIVNVIDKMTDEPGFSICVNCDELAKGNAEITPGIYINKKDSQRAIPARNPEDIIKELYSINKEKDRLKITINANAAKCFGNKFFMACAQIQQSAEATRKINDAMTSLGFESKIWIPDPITISKDKNVIRIEQNSDLNGISSILTTMINCWTQHMCYLNQNENILLAELRDVLLPKLMNGTYKGK